MSDGLIVLKALEMLGEPKESVSFQEQRQAAVHAIAAFNRIRDDQEATKDILQQVAKIAFNLLKSQYGFDEWDDE